MHYFSTSHLISFSGETIKYFNKTPTNNSFPIFGDSFFGDAWFSLESAFTRSKSIWSRVSWRLETFPLLPIWLRHVNFRLFDECPKFMSGVADIDGTAVCSGDEISSEPHPLLFAVFTFEVVYLFSTLFFRNSSFLKNQQVGIFMLAEPDPWLSFIFFKQRVKPSSKFFHLRFSVSTGKTVWASEFKRRKIFFV